MRSSVFFKLLGAFVLVIAIATVILDFAVRQEWESSLRQQITQSLTEKARMFAERVEANGATAQLVAQQAKAADARATAIDATGRVLADSEADPAQMENHATRPEFVAALAGKVGVASRTSKTVGIEFLYVAVPVRGGAVRLAYPLSLIEQTTAVIRNRLLLASAIALFFATLIAAILAHLMGRRLRRIVDFAGKIATGDLTARISDHSYDEISQLATALDATARMLEASFADLQISKRQLETLLNSIPNPVIAINNDRNVQWTNRAMQALEPRIKAGVPLIETLRNPDLLRAFQTAIADSSTQTASAISLIPGKSFNVTAAPIAGGGAVAVLQDVTEIERVEKTRRDFIANVSHELRTPLTSIKGFVETVLDTYPGDRPDRQFLEIIQKNASRMTRLTDDLLVLARVESGEDKLNSEAVAVTELLGEARDSFMSIAAIRGVKLEVEHAGDYQVFADKYAIQQVFGNLIENAIKYSEAGARVVLGAQLNGIGIEFYVQDYGPGIASEHQPRLFERFYRVDASRSRESGGTGLGLAIVKHIVMNHGGSVRVESALGHGSTFFFTLPLAD